MKTKVLVCWLGACLAVMARPGDLDRSFDPELRAWVAPDHVTVAADGRAWIGGGFDRGDSYSTGDLVKLGENGGVESEPTLGYLERDAHFPYRGIFRQSNTSGVSGYYGYQFVQARPAKPFVMANGDFLLPAAPSNWLRMSANGEVIGKAFPDRAVGLTITPQFERDGKLWVIQHSSNGERIVQTRNSVDGMLDQSFSQASALPRNINTVIPGPNGGAWVMAGDVSDPFILGPMSPMLEQQVILIDSVGNRVGVPLKFAVPRTLDLVAGPSGSFRLAYGPDQSRWFYWPAPSSASYKIEWYSASGRLERTMEFGLGLYENFAWAEAADGSLVVTDSRVKSTGSPFFLIANSANLRRYRPVGEEDTTFISPGRVRSVKAMSEGKWLIDGVRRLNANGSEDLSWKAPELSRPAIVHMLLALPAGRVLVGGDFATVDGLVKNRLAVFGADGVIDPSFTLDERIAEWQSVTVSGKTIYVLTSEPVVYGNGTETNVVKLRSDGTLDETYKPALTTQLTPVTGRANVSLYLPKVRATRITGMTNGELLVGTIRDAGDIFYFELLRLRENGSPVPGFRLAENYSVAGGCLALKNGGFISGGVIFRPNGSVERDLTRSNSSLVPLCECPTGILFRSGEDGSTNRLALWTRAGFARWFRPPALDWSKPVSATPGELGTIYLAATLVNGRPTIHRLSLTGQLDRAFRGPVFENHRRQSGEYWWKAEETGKAAFDPA